MKTIIENKFCLVTSLFNIKREEMSGNDGRSWDDYLKWFEKTLQIKSPMIIFVENDMVEFVESRREYPTKIITHSISEIPYYYLKDKIQDILNMDEYQKKIDCPERIECNYSIYSVIQYSKFKWLKKASEVNPFNSKFFFWLDAGASRFLYDCSLENEYPSEVALQELEKIDNTFLIQYNTECYPDLVNSQTLPESYFWDNRSFICGSMFGGNKTAVENISEEIDQILDYMIENNNVNNEQIAIGYLCKVKENLFTRFHRNNGKNHLCLFQEMV